MTESSTLSMRDRVALIRLPDNADAPITGRTNWLPWSLCILLSFACVSMAARPRAVVEKASADDANATGTKAPASSQSTVATGEVILESKGYIIPAHQIQVSPIEVSGRIVELYIEEGRYFAKDAILAVLDKSSFAAEHLEAQANVLAMKAKLKEHKNGSRPEEIQQATAELKEAEETQKMARLKFERSKSLGATAMSADEFEQSQYAYTALSQRVAKLAKTLELAKLGPRQERIEVAEAEVKLAEAREQRTKWRLDNCTIRAPVAGTILKKTAEIGNLVSPLSFNVSASVCEMADLSDLEVDLEINERDIAKVQKGQVCRVRTDAYPDRPYSGVVDRLMPIANRSKGAIPVRVKLTVPKEEEGAYLKPEMGAIVTFLAK